MKKSSLKFGLVGMLIVFAVIPVLVLGVVGTFSIAGYSNNVRTGELTDVSLSKAGVVDTLFEGYQAEATALSKMKNVIANAKNKGSEGKGELDAVTENSSDIYDALILDDKGSVLASSRNKETGTFENFNEDNMPSVSPLVSWEKYDFDTAFFVSHEIYADPDNKTGGLLGYVCLVISPEEGSSLKTVVSGSYLDGKAHLALIDSEGNALNFDGNGRFMKSSEVDSSFNASSIFGKVSDSTDSKSASSKTYSHKSGKYYYTVGAIPNVTSWRWVGIAESGAMSSFASGTNIKAWIIVVVSVLLASVLGFLIVTRFVGRMHDILRKMDGITAEEGAVTTMRFDVKNDKSELGMIQKSFNEFLDEVNLNSQRYRTIANLSDNMLFEWDFHKEIMYVSDNTFTKFDVNTQNATLQNGRFIDALMPPEDAERYKHDITTLLKNKNKVSGEYQLRTKNGNLIWVSVSATCIVDRVDEPIRVIGVINDIDNEKKMELQLSERASYDFLSQLYNRSTFIRMLGSELDHRGPKKVGVMFIDVDDFKFINDRYGHTVGDEVIRYVADTIRTKVDDRGGFAGRFGGDEFVLCFTDQGDIANAEQIAMDIIDELYVGYTTTEGMLINVRASIGISYCPEHTEDVNELLSYSDTAMYFVKKNGKTNYHVYVPEDSESGEYIDPEGF